jgi:hypothetical protein
MAPAGVDDSQLAHGAARQARNGHSRLSATVDRRFDLSAVSEPGRLRWLRLLGGWARCRRLRRARLGRWILRRRRGNVRTADRGGNRRLGLGREGRRDVRRGCRDGKRCASVGGRCELGNRGRCHGARRSNRHKQSGCDRSAGGCGPHPSYRAQPTIYLSSQRPSAPVPRRHIASTAEQAVQPAPRTPARRRSGRCGGRTSSPRPKGRGASAALQLRADSQDPR